MLGLGSNTPLPIWSSNSNPSDRIWRRSDHGADLPSKIFAAKYHAVEGSWRVVDLGREVTGFSLGGYERLVRDARLGRIHPANSFLTHEVVAKTVLGISLDEQPRWG
jgi:alkylation response protein AidB-like acyl-CoA dehydrogenase